MQHRFDTEHNQPINSLTKLTRIKKNIFPHLINSQSSSHIRENSYSGSNSNNNYNYNINNLKGKYSTLPINTEPEVLISENISLKTSLNKIKSELMLAKIEIKTLEKEIAKKDKLMHDLFPNDHHLNPNQSQIDQQQGKIIETQIIHQLKKQFKELRREYDDKVKSYEDLKKTLKNTKVNELLIENNILSEEYDKMKQMYLTSQETIMSLEKNEREIISMKEALSKQDFIILNFQENYKKMQEELKEKTAEIERLSKNKVEKQEAINRLNKKLSFQCQVNDKLITVNENIPGTKEYMVMKRDFEVKVNELKRDIAVYKEEIEKKDKVIRELKKNEYANYIQLGKGNDNESKIFNLQNKLSNEKEEKMRLMNRLKQIEKDKNYNTNNRGSNNNNNGSITNNNSTSIQIYDKLYNNYTVINEEEECDYMSDSLFNEYIYILLKNFEAKKINAGYLDANLFNQETLGYLSDESTVKDFILSVSSNICKILSIDQLELLSFMKTIIYTYYLSNTNPMKSIEEFKSKFLNCFEGIISYTKDQCDTYNQRLISKLYSKKDEIEKEFAFFDENKSGFITFTILKKIFDHIKLNLNSELLEYLIYLMKSSSIEDNNNDHTTTEGNVDANINYNNINESISIRKLSYAIIQKMLNETKAQPPYTEEESMIEITNDEYLAKVSETISKIKAAIVNSKKQFNDLFSIDETLKSIKGKDSIALSKVIQILKETFNLELSHLEIFCLYSKVRFDDEKEGKSTEQSNNTNNSNEETIDDVIDYAKFKKEFDDLIVSYTQKPMNANNLQIAYVLSESFGIDQKKNELIYDLLNVLKTKCISFERLIFPFHCKMKLEMTSGKYNRYLELNLFKEMLIKNGIHFSHNSLIAFLLANELMFIHDKVNLDYLKVYLIVNTEEEKGNSFDKEEIYEEIKENNKGNEFELGNIEDEDSESFQQIQKDIYKDDEDDDEVEDKDKDKEKK